MRLNECEQVKEALDKHLGINLIVLDGTELFLSRLKGVNEPGKKRKIIGATCMFYFLEFLYSFLKTSNLSAQSSIFSNKKPFGSRRRLKTPPTQAQSNGSCKALYVLSPSLLEYC